MTNNKLAIHSDVEYTRNRKQKSTIDNDQYSLSYKALHWIMALAMMALLIAGQQFNFDLSDEYRLHGLKLHSSVGSLALVAAAVLLLKRFLLRHRRPESHLPYLQNISANLVQFGLYALAIAIPVTGLLSAFYSPNDVMLFGAFDISLATGDTEQAYAITRNLHRWSTRLAMLLLISHAGAAVVSSPCSERQRIKENAVAIEISSSTAR